MAKNALSLTPQAGYVKPWSQVTFCHNKKYFKQGENYVSMGLIGAGNNPMVGMTVAVAVAMVEACK